MKSRLRVLTALHVALLFGALGCGDEGGCGPAPDKQETEAAPAGGGGHTGSSSGGGEIIMSDRKGRVPKPYQRPASKYEGEKSTATISKPVIAISTQTVATGYAALKGVSAKITKRKVDGVADRVEVTCRILAASADGQCASAVNYEDIKSYCCPGGLIERCKTTMSGVVLVGRGCDLSKR